MVGQGAHVFEVVSVLGVKVGRHLLSSSHGALNQIVRHTEDLSDAC